MRTYLETPHHADEIARLPNTGFYVYELNATAPTVEDPTDIIHVYVGYTQHLRGRIQTHSRKWWWASIDWDSCGFYKEATKERALEIESILIHEMQPAMNRAGRLLVVGQ